MTFVIFVLTLLSFQAPLAIDNPRVQVRELEGAVDSIPYDSVWVSRTGRAVFLKNGSKHEADGKGILIGLRDLRVPPLPNTSGYPLAMPRPGSKKLLENDRVIVWDYAWTPDVPTPMHFHDKDVVVFYLEDGALQSTTPSGEKTVNEYKPGMIRFNLRDRTHTETLIRGKQHAIITELK
ncbi:MAG: hypothetical protein JWO19_3510 [Bryobacterales bacterium]|nr:hypothetical protein [Bryobacterales bacterium]